MIIAILNGGPLDGHALELSEEIWDRGRVVIPVTLPRKETPETVNMTRGEEYFAFGSETLRHVYALREIPASVPTRPSINRWMYESTQGGEN